MRRTLTSLCFGLAWCVPASSLAQVETRTHDALRGALTCTPNPVKTVESLVARGSDFAAGVATVSFGSGTDRRSVVVLRTPLTVAGATATAVILETTPSHEDFGGVVYARFTGDLKKVLTELKLGARHDLAGVALGAYERQLAIEPGGERAQVCPMTIVATPLNAREFLLGCGWCPG